MTQVKPVQTIFVVTKQKLKKCVYAVGNGEFHYLYTGWNYTVTEKWKGYWSQVHCILQCQMYTTAYIPYHYRFCNGMPIVHERQHCISINPTCPFSLFPFVLTSIQYDTEWSTFTLSLSEIQKTEDRDRTMVLCPTFTLLSLYNLSYIKFFVFIINYFLQLSHKMQYFPSTVFSFATGS